MNLDRAEPIQPSAPLAPILPFSREAREIAQSDRRAYVDARNDFNHARVRQHRTELLTRLEAAEADSRAYLASYAMQKCRQVDDIANRLAGMERPGLEMTIREIQAAYQAGEVAKVIRRGMDL